MIDIIIGGFLVSLVLAMLIYGIKLELDHHKYLALSSELEELGKKIRLHTFLIQQAHESLKGQNSEGIDRG